jgi:hypothetical protein
LLVGICVCSSPAQIADVDWIPVPAPELGAVVARVGQVPIYASQVVAEARRAGKPPRAALDDLVASHLLAEEARRDGWRPVASSEPDVRSALVQRLLERELEPHLRAEAVPDHVLRLIYDRAKDSFVHPRLVEVGALAIDTGALMKGEGLEQRRRAANDLAAFLKNHPARSLDDFIAVARDPVWSSRHVAYDHFLQSADRPLSPKVGEQIAKLRSLGETTGLLTDDEGFYIARYISERPAENITFEQTREKLLAGFLERWQQQQFLEFTGHFVQAHKVEAYYDRLPRNEPGP